MLVLICVLFQYVALEKWYIFAFQSCKLSVLHCVPFYPSINFSLMFFSSPPFVLNLKIFIPILFPCIAKGINVTSFFRVSWPNYPYKPMLNQIVYTFVKSLVRHNFFIFTLRHWNIIIITLFNISACHFPLMFP